MIKPDPLWKHECPVHGVQRGSGLRVMSSLAREKDGKKKKTRICSVITYDFHPAGMECGAYCSLPKQKEVAYENRI